MSPFVGICLLAVFISAVAQMFLKYSAKQTHKSWLYEYLNPWVFTGYAILGTALLLNIFAMRHGVELKTLMAVESLGYLFIPLLSYMVFKEKINARKALAIGLIIAGVLVFFC